MGTAVGITVVGDGAEEAVEQAFAWLAWVDETFSTYREDSQISRLGRGEMSLDDAAPEVRHVLARCDELTAATDGRFSIRPGTPDRPPLDPSGLVKGWSIDEAGLILRMAGFDRFMINAGGDVLCSGEPPGRAAWPIGIRHPLRADAVAAVVDLHTGAIATSGTYERGEHIWGLRGQSRLLSATVVGPTLGTTDALATAVFADPDDLRWLGWFPGHDLVLIGADARVRWTPGLDGRISLGDEGPVPAA
jgi:thiamine biosynthesis lipoprotein